MSQDWNWYRDEEALQEEAKFESIGFYVIWEDPDRENTYLSSELLLPNEAALALDRVKATNAIITRTGTIYVNLSHRGAKAAIAPNGKKGQLVKMTFLHNRETVDAWVVE